jgi:Platelet-activating factor acetylhydrolase, isoform II
MAALHSSRRANLTRRSVLGALTATGVGLLLPGRSAGASAAAPGQVRLALPRPTGPHRIGTVALHLIDRSRRDPWIPSHPVRQLMVNVWYPATDVEGHPVAPWLEPAAWQQYQIDNGLPTDLLVVPPTHGHLGAPTDGRDGPHPVVLFSPGSGGNRNGDTYIVEELVSFGYVVVTIDHTHDSSEVQFPDGHVEVRTIPPDTTEINTEATGVRAADIRFVVDCLEILRAGGNPDAEHRRLPARLPSALDLHRTAMFGHSMGGATTAWAMRDDHRLRAGINLDGTFYGPVVTAGLDRPFMLMSSELHTRDDDETWAQLWARLTGWRLDLRLRQAGHNSYSDVQPLLPEAADALGWTPGQVSQLIGTIDPARAIQAVRAYIRAFFDLHLRHHDSHLLDAPSPQFPEMEFIP